MKIPMIMLATVFLISCENLETHTIRILNSNANKITVYSVGGGHKLMSVLPFNSAQQTYFSNHESFPTKLYYHSYVLSSEVEKTAKINWRIAIKDGELGNFYIKSYFYATTCIIKGEAFTCKPGLLTPRDFK